MYSGVLKAIPVPLTFAESVMVSEIILQYFMCFKEAISISNFKMIN